jgi:tetratricopeptide (TPR) repeat protein
VETSQETITRKALRSGTATGLFFLLFYLYVWLVVDPRLVLHGLGILTPYYLFSFHTGWPFFLEHLARVGGLVEYGARLLSQFYAFGWVGALIVTAAAWCLGFLAERLIRRGGRTGGSVLPCVPAAIVLVMYCGYSHPPGPVLSLLTALGGFALYVRLAPGAPIGRAATLLIACPVLYHAAGAGSLLFAVLVAIDELLIGNRKRVAAAALACALVVPWAAGTLCGLDFKRAYAGFLVSAPGVAPGRRSHTLALYLFFPTVLAGSVLWGNARAGEASPGAKAVPPAAKPPRRPHQRGPSPGQESRRFPVRRVPARAVAATAFFCGVGAAAWLSLDSLTRTVLEMDYYAQHERWTEVLRSADRLPKGIYNHRCNRNVMQALYHTGRLADEMFRYSQRRVDLFSTPAEYRDLGAYFQESRLFLDLGQVNLAERCAYEALAISGEQPAILEQLAMIHAVQGEPETARIFLNALAKHPFYRQAAREMLRRLEADPALENDRRASRIRGNMVSRDSIAQVTSTEEFLQILLEKNPHNKMAFELLMAHYLSDKRPEKVVANLPRLKDFSYPRVPRHYQEALAARALSSDRPPPVPGFELDPEALRRAGDFQRITAGATSPQEAVRAALEAGLGDSYFFYLACSVSGL